MNKRLIQALEASISDVLETMFFCTFAVENPGDQGPGPEESDASGWLAARIDFGGALKGSMCLRLPHGLAAVLTADFLGVEQDMVDDRQVGEMVKEILNMIAGNTFTRFDSGMTIDLGIPVGGYRDAGHGEISGDTGGILISGETPHGRLVCELSLEQDGCRASEQSRS